MASIITGKSGFGQIFYGRNKWHIYRNIGSNFRTEFLIVFTTIACTASYGE